MSQSWTSIPAAQSDGNRSSASPPTAIFNVPAAGHVSIDTSGYATDVGEAATVTATISCTANLSDIGVPGLPGAKTITASWTSPIDTYRAR